MPNRTRSSPPALAPATEWLVLRIQDGDRSAGEKLVELWHPRLLAHARRLLSRDDAADEVLQESWIGIIKGLRRLRDPARFPAWAYGIVSRQAALWIRRKPRPTGQIEEDPSSPPDPIAVESDAERLRLAIATLTPLDQALVALRYESDLSMHELADAMALPEGTVKRRLHDIRHRLRQAMLQPELQAPTRR